MQTKVKRENIEKFSLNDSFSQFDNSKINLNCKFFNKILILFFLFAQKLYAVE